jgi:hypothetical protein
MSGRAPRPVRRLRPAPQERLLAAKVLAPSQVAELIAYRESLNPAAIGREIAELGNTLFKLSKDRTEQLYLATFPSALPDVRRGSGRGRL